MSKQWGISLPNSKLKALLAKHTKPDNCPDITTARVNPEIWDQMNNFRRKADLRVSNIQQALQKATFGILKVCNKLVDQQPSTDKETLAANIDAIVLLGHAVGELSCLCQEQIKLALKAEFHSLCSQANKSSGRSYLLFGADLAKQVRDVKDTNRIGKDKGVGKAGTTRSSHPYNSHHDKRRPQKNYGKHYRPAESKPPFLGKGQKKPNLSKKANREDMIQSLENIKKSVSEFPSLVHDLKEYLDNRCTQFRAGCTTKSISNWQMITSDKEILTSIRGATIEFDTQPYNTKRPQSTFSAEESAIIDSEVAKLLSKNIIETTDHTPYEVISNIFIRPKKDGGHRLILNLKGLNQFVTYHHFKMETLQSIVQLVEKNCYMASLDFPIPTLSFLWSPTSFFFDLWIMAQ